MTAPTLLQLHFDWTVNLTTILSGLWFLIVIPAYKFLHKMDTTLNRIMNWLREYPPHIHDSDGNTRYPRGMSPDD